MKSICRSFVLGLILVACKSPAPSPAPESFSGQMRDMAADVRILVSYIYDREAFQSPQARPQILRALRDFANVSHAVDAEAGRKFIGDDLLMEYSIGHLKEDAGRALQSFEAGRYEFSRAVAKASLNHCFRCHSVSDAGGKAHWDLGGLQALKFQPLEKADLLVALRQYDKAIEHMEGLLLKPPQDLAQTPGFDFESLLRRYLALMIRVEKDPKRAIAALEKIAAKPETPRYVGAQIDGWTASLEAWAKERARPPKTAKELFRQVDRRFQQASSIQHFERDHSGDVEYLRATSLLHDGMKLKLTPTDQAKALFMLGRAYEVLDDLGSWNLHENYYQACLMRAPAAPTAKPCFTRLEASLYMGYSGSSGTHLPQEEKDRLEKLRTLLNVK